MSFTAQWKCQELSLLSQKRSVLSQFLWGQQQHYWIITSGQDSSTTTSKSIDDDGRPPTASREHAPVSHQPITRVSTTDRWSQHHSPRTPLFCRQVQGNNMQNITLGDSFDPTWCSGANVSPGWKTTDNWIWQAIYSNAFIYAELIQSFQSYLLKHWHPHVFCCHHLTLSQEQMWLGCTIKWCSNALI